jgi:hypothetical protein
LFCKKYNFNAKKNYRNLEVLQNLRNFVPDK